MNNIVYNIETDRKLKMLHEHLLEIMAVYADNTEQLHLHADGIMIDVIHALMYVVDLPASQIVLIDEIIDLWNQAEKRY